MGTRSFPAGDGALVYQPAGPNGALLAKTGTYVTIYTDEALTTIATGLIYPDGSPVVDGRLLVDATSRLPRFRDPAGRLVLYSKPDGSSVATALYADSEEFIALANASYALTTADRIRYVSPRGLDSNDGLTTGRALKSLQAAYDALPAAGGSLFLAAGRYDVGAGLVLTKGKPFRMVGSAMGMAARFASRNVYASVPDGLGPVIYSSASAPDSLIRWTGNGQIYGCSWEGLCFEITNASTLRMIDGHGLCMSIVRDCFAFFGTSANPLARFIDAYNDANGATADDSSWLRLENNVVNGGGLAKLGTSLSDTAAFQADNNQHVIVGNVGLGRDHEEINAPFVELNRATRCYVAGNNIERYMTGIVDRGGEHNTYVGDGGERVATFVRLIGSRGCHVAPVGITAPTILSGGSVLVSLEQSARSNVLILPAVNVDTAAYADGDYTTLDSAVTVTNANRSDNTIISPYESIVKDRTPVFVPASAMDVAGTGITKLTAGPLRYVSYPATGSTDAFTADAVIPRAWRRVDVVALWMPPDSVNVTGDARLRLSYGQPGVGASSVASTTVTAVTGTASGTRWFPVETTVASGLTLDRTKPVSLLLTRVGDDAGDTLAGPAGLIGLLIRPS